VRDRLPRKGDPTRRRALAYVEALSDSGLIYSSVVGEQRREAEEKRAAARAASWQSGVHRLGADAVAFELAYWSGVGGAERFDAILEMARESLIAGGENGDLPRLPGSDWGVRRR
jgi:hypothetical protein